jgi:radical SAM protein with 4Fe4S-binding SPASM domain
MNMDVFRSIIDQSVGSRLVKPIIKLIGLGEPLLNPQIASMVKYAKRKGLTVEMISNFTSANPKVFAKFVESQLDYLGVSLDSTSPQTFERIRVGARFGEVVDNVKLFLNIRKSLNSEKPRVFFRSTISQGNAEEIPTIAEFAKSINVDYVVFSNQIISKEESHKYSRFITPRHDKSHREAMSWFQKKTSVCHAMTGCYVTHDGKIMPCNFLMEIIPREKYPQFEFGVISRSSFSSIWFSKRYKQFRARKALGFHPHFCNSCPCIP